MDPKVTIFPSVFIGLSIFFCALQIQTYIVYVGSSRFEKLRGRFICEKRERPKGSARENVYNLSIDCLSRIRLVHSRTASSSGSAQGKVESDGRWSAGAEKRQDKRTAAGQTCRPSELRTFVAEEASAGYRASDSRANVGRGGSTKVKPTTPGKPTFPTGPGRDVVDKPKYNRRVLRNEQPPVTKLFFVSVHIRQLLLACLKNCHRFSDIRDQSFVRDKQNFVSSLPFSVHFGLN